MAPVPCPSCKKPMNEQAVVCPHCNARRADVPTGAAGKNLSPAEIRAMLVLQSGPPQRSTMSSLLMPHPSTTGNARTAELVLTLISLPLVLSGILALQFSRGSRERLQKVGGDETAPAILMVLVGSGVLWTLLDLGLHASGLTVAMTLLVTTVALIARSMIRSRAAAREA